MSFDVKHFFSAGVYIKQMRLESGNHVLTHEHNFDHFGLLGKGSAIVDIDGNSTVYNAPCPIEIKAGLKHKITAVTDIDWFCIHATDVTDPEKIDQVLIKES